MVSMTWKEKLKRKAGLIAGDIKSFAKDKLDESPKAYAKRTRQMQAKRGYFEEKAKLERAREAARPKNDAENPFVMSFGAPKASNRASGGFNPGMGYNPYGAGSISEERRKRPKKRSSRGSGRVIIIR